MNGTHDSTHNNRSKLDPRSKLALALAWSILVILSERWEILLIASAITGSAIIGARQRAAWLKTLRLTGLMTAFLALVMLWAFDPAIAGQSSLRFILLITTFFIYFQTTTPEDLANAMVASGAPYTLAFIITAATRFVPVLAHKMSEVSEAQRARGIRLEAGWSSLRNYAALLAPLLIQTFLLADQLAEAMEARGFSRPHRTFAQEYRLRAWDWGIIALSGIIVIIGWIVR